MLQLDQGYEEGEHLAAAITVNADNEKLLLVRMPHDFEPQNLGKSQLGEMLLGKDATRANDLKEQKQEFLEKHGLGDDYQVSIQAKCNELSTFRAVVKDGADKRSTIGPAFDRMISINKKIVQVPGNGSENDALKKGIRSRLPKSMVMPIPSSYAKMDQVEGLSSHYMRAEGETPPRGKKISSEMSGKKRKSSKNSTDQGKRKKSK